MTATLVPATATGIVCGKCSTFSNKVRHASVAAVKLCSYGPTTSVVTNQTAANAEWAEAKNEAAALERAQEAAAYMAPVQMHQPHRPATKPAPVSVAAGRYAVVHEGTLKFYRVDRPTEGKWAGFTFVKVQASDTEYPIRNKASREAILALIAVDPKAAMLRYGQEIGSCGHCGRTLTNEESRAAGIGPICRGRMGW